MFRRRLDEAPLIPDDLSFIWWISLYGLGIALGLSILIGLATS